MEQNKKTTLDFVIRITDDLSEIRISELGWPTELSGEVMRKTLNRITTELTEVKQPLSKGKLERLSGVKLPSFIYVLEENITGNRVQLYRFVRFGQSVINPVSKQLILPTVYEHVEEIPFPLHEPVDAVQINTSEDELSVTVEFKCSTTPVVKNYTHPVGTLPEFNVFRP